MKPFEQWPLIMKANDVVECAGVTITDAHAILKRAPTIDPDKSRNRSISRGSLKKYLQEE